MTWLALTSAIAVGTAFGREGARWLDYLTEPLQQFVRTWFRRRAARYDDDSLGGPIA